MENLKKLLIDVFAPKKDETFIILNDFPSEESEIDQDYIERKDMAKEWHKILSEIGNVEPIIYFEPTKAHSAPLPEKAQQDNKEIDLDKKLETFGEKNIVLAITKFSATGPLFSLMKEQNFRGATLPGATPDMQAFKADYQLVAKKAKILADKLEKANAAVVAFSTGHEIYFDLRDRKVVKDDGVCHNPGQGINLPSGEAFVTPNDTPGSKTKGYLPVYYDKHLLVYEVEENRIVDVISDSPKSKEMQKYFKDDPVRGNIAELGLGCNDKAVFINNILQDEKIEGMHWAYGYNKYMGGNIDISDFKNPLSAVHMDIIYTTEAKIKVHKITLVYPDKSREVIMENSRYSFNIRKLFNS